MGTNKIQVLFVDMTIGESVFSMSILGLRGTNAFDPPPMTAPNSFRDGMDL